MDATAVRRIWSELLAAVRATSRSTEAMLTNAMVSEVDGNVVTITHTSAPLARRLAESRNTEAIATALSSVLGGTWQVRCTHGTPGATAQQSTPAKAARPAPTRPSQAQNQQSRPQPEPQQTQAPRPPIDDVPPPPEPPEPDDPLPPEPDDEEAMLAEAARPVDPATVNEVQAKDPESVMLQLLADELGARPLKKA
jgi:DNA polymerase III subunit gamma/tau